MAQRKTILIVEDNEINRIILRQILASRYDIIEAGNGQEALDILGDKRNEVALIISGVVMPVMDGYAFLDRLKADKRLSTIPVIIMTQGEREEDEILALTHGANDYIPKPYRTQVIQHRVSSLIKLRETAAMVSQLRLDELTGLYSKNYFYHKVRECLEFDKVTEYVILCINFENFKLYNDMFGRKAGDRLLVEMAEFLREKLGKEAIFCRYTADRFLCLVDRNAETNIRRDYIEKGKVGLSRIAQNITVKMGIYEIVNRSISVEQMCDRALLAVDSIKGLYNTYLAVYNDELRETLLREKKITDAMEDALEQKQFEVYFQPKYSIIDNRMVGAEALVRWNHPEMGSLSPGEFVPLFEKNGFIYRLDQYVWENTCKRLHDWDKKGYPIVPISVNVSRADIFQGDLDEIFCGLIRKYELNPSFLHLEITESAYTDSPEQIIHMVTRLRECGFIIEMDDFGSGYSSLNMFSQMPIDILKLDMGFVRSELERPVEKSILNDIINMAHRLHLCVVAEGVETGEQKLQLKALGCDYAQGYFFARPMPGREFEKLLNMYTKLFRSLVRDVHVAGENTWNGDVYGAKRTVLIVEDDPINREILRDILKNQYIVLTAENGKEAIDILEGNGQYISAILLDLQMPVMDGYEFMHVMKENYAYNKIPILVITSSNDVEVEKKCLEAGADDFVTKPYNSSLIVARVESLVHLRECNTLLSELDKDTLTGFKNRKAYYDDIAFLQQDPARNQQPLGVLLADINGLKAANDKDGHESGDRLIVSIARVLKSVFTGADMYRLGGDEFVVLSYDESEKDFRDKLDLLDMHWKEGMSAATGSVWLEDARNLEQQVAIADRSMRQDKRQYYEIEQHNRRRDRQMAPEELLRKVDEVSEYLPGGFFIYKADESERIISFNREVVKLFECETEEEFHLLTRNSFRGMVHPDDIDRVHSEIKAQIRKENDIDYVEYRILCKDGTEKLVRDYGRFIHTNAYGDVYYVFVNDITQRLD